jgi:sodium transport system permease protein
VRWSHIKLIFTREVRDQLRDRRTMFTVLFLPLLLYPLMGSVMFEVAQFHREHKVVIGVVGAENLPESSAILDDDADPAVQWKVINESARLQQCVATFLNRNSDVAADQNESPPQSDLKLKKRGLEDCLREFACDSIVCIPPDFRLNQWNVPVRVISNLGWERSTIANSLFDKIVQSEHKNWLRGQLDKTDLGSSIIEPPVLETLDASPPNQKGVFLWSKLLPFVVLIWALTGAFYPAIDLCAGEKERGTLETLLCSPARRLEIVWGKLLTIICFSLGTALLNLMSMYVTASMVIGRMTSLPNAAISSVLAPLPIQSLGWLVLLVVPISIMFSALALAVASLAKSTKEGQYYLMPLLLVGMPLVSLPMLPGVTLSPGTSIIPVTGAVLLSRSLMDGEYLSAVLHIPTVATITIVCTLLAVRWAVRQFENETAMLKDGGRYSFKNWLRDAWRKRESTPTVNEAVVCGLLILAMLFFGRLSLGLSDVTWVNLAVNTLSLQLGLMLGPALIMAVMLTKSLPTAFRVNKVSLPELAAVGLLAISIHPSYVTIANAINSEYKLGDETIAMLKQVDTIISSAPFWSVLFCLAALPAITEELVFRGFLFSGLERSNGHLRAILATSILFGLSHGVLQQSIAAGLMGLLLGWIAARSGSVLTAMLFHLFHNSLSLGLSINGRRGNQPPDWVNWAITYDSGAWSYTEIWSTLSIGVSITLIAFLATRPWMQPRSFVALENAS